MLKKSSYTVLLGTFIIIAVLITGQYVGFFHPLNNVLTKIFSPLARLSYNFGELFTKDKYTDLNSDELRNRLEKVEVDNRRLLAENGRLAEIEKENKQLKDIIGYRQTVSQSVLVARVIARSGAENSSRQQTITLDQGNKQGLATGLPITDAEGIVVGRVTDTKDYLAEGCLLFKDSCRFAVAIQGQAGTVGILQSDLNLTLKIDFIPYSRSVEVGQIIITSGLETGVPAGLVIGQVTEVIKEGNELWQHALVKPLGNFDTLSIVGVIK